MLCLKGEVLTQSFHDVPSINVLFWAAMHSVILRVCSFGMIQIRINWSKITPIMAHQKEPKDPSPEWIHQFVWCTMIQVILDHWSWSGSSQRKAPLACILWIDLICDTFARFILSRNHSSDKLIVFSILARLDSQLDYPYSILDTR